MNPRSRKLLLWLQGGIIFFATLLFGATLWGWQLHKKIEANIAAGPTAADFDAKFATRLGKPYTKEDHRKLVDIIALNDSALEDLGSAMGKLPGAVFRLSGVMVFLSLFSVFLILRSTSPAAGLPNRDD
ncbi:hypothetical protein [Luteolibacter luteus]|uniref:Uncharacterized protein n=1 Tax=Luteolibacter luteus TaxID=2728835 RepID=A0A858RMW3_9BACT|nr:hypothetical protein [Luteolibacter luteus]QJE97699.1 hypothetical protein HHL09_18565 [Luteolibacter luteus]